MRCKNWRNSLLACAAAVALAACLPQAGVDSPAPSPVTGNSSPTIAGQPSMQASVGTNWSFQPSAADSDGDALTFSAVGLPGWASINPQTGLIQGTPGPGDAGTTGQIIVRVSDGEATASMPGFQLTVSATPSTAVGSATLRWLPPTQYTDGTSLSAAELAGYRVYYGRSPDALDDFQDIDGPDATTVVIDDLVAGTHYFGVTALTVSGMESGLSPIRSKTIL
jgi:hypothetical protein